MEECNMVGSVVAASAPAGRVLRYPLPSDGRESAATRCVKRIAEATGKADTITRFVKRITDAAGVVHEFEFDFIPDPWWAAFCGCVWHTCQTCEWKNRRGTACCPAPTPTQDTPCAAWEPVPSAYVMLSISHYKALHEKHYGKTCISL